MPRVQGVSLGLASSTYRRVRFRCARSRNAPTTGPVSPSLRHSGEQGGLRKDFPKRSGRSRIASTGPMKLPKRAFSLRLTNLMYAAGSIFSAAAANCASESCSPAAKLRTRAVPPNSVIQRWATSRSSQPSARYWSTESTRWLRQLTENRFFGGPVDLWPALASAPWPGL